MKTLRITSDELSQRKKQVGEREVEEKRARRKKRERKEREERREWMRKSQAKPSQAISELNHFFSLEFKFQFIGFINLIRRNNNNKKTMFCSFETCLRCVIR